MLKQGTRVLVTGGAGFLGSHVTRGLVAAGCQVRVLDDLSTGRRERLDGLGSRLELLHADVRNPQAVRKAVHGAELLVHLAAIPASADPGRAQEVNLGGALNVLEAARRVDRPERPRVVLCGSGAVYGKQAAFVLHEELAPRPALPEAVMALAAEQYGRVYHEAYGVPVFNLRIFRTFGPDEDPDRPDASVVAKLIKAALDGTSPVIHGDGQQTRDLIYVDNVVAAVFAAAVTPDLSAEPLNVASGEAVAINFLWTVVLELVGKKRLAIEPTYVPAPHGDIKHARPQVQRSCKQLGWAPSVRLRDGLARTVQHYLALRNADPNAWFSPREDALKLNIRRSGSQPNIVPVTAGRTPPPPPVDASSRATPLPQPPPRRVEELDADELEVVEDAPDLDVEWAPVPQVPGLG